MITQCMSSPPLAEGDQKHTSTESGQPTFMSRKVIYTIFKKRYPVGEDFFLNTLQSTNEYKWKKCDL